MTGARALPNLLTASRLVLGLAMWICLAVPVLSNDLTGEQQFALREWAFWLFVAAAATDFFDGWLARRIGAVSLTGAILDPIADKILVAGATLGLLTVGAGAQFAIPASLILFREFAVSALRESTAGQGVTLPVTLLAKWKTTIQLVALGLELFLASRPEIYDTPVLGLHASLWAHGAMWIAAAITLWTGFEYLLAARRGLRAPPQA